jgi:hypothetical protein
MNIKSGLIIGALLTATVAVPHDKEPSRIGSSATVDNEPTMLLPHKSLDMAIDQVVTMCSKQGLEITQQTRNTVVCHTTAIEVRFTLVKLSTGTRVSWTQKIAVYNGIPVGDRIANAIVQASIIQADPNYHFKQSGGAGQANPR